jgi:predicted NBD/HSP70 family sugar kinase
VVANRAGGEIVAVAGGDAAWQEDVPGRRWPVHKASRGGWSQLRYQRSAEEAWEENAKQLAASVIDAAERVRPEHIVMAGDMKARSLLLRHLTTPLRSRAVQVDREVAADSPAMAQAVNHSATALADRECRARFGEWQVRRAHAGTVEGLAATLAALREGRVSDLFAADRPSSAATVWIGPDGADVAVSAAELRARGVPDPVRERADAAIVRALAATDAELHFLPEDLVVSDGAGRGSITFPPDGICATLRWSEAG